MFVLDAIKAYASTDRIAFQNRGDTVSFAELDARSSAFAAFLLSRFGADRTPVVIYGHKQRDIPACFFGALKSGRAYVPVDLTTPPERAAEIIREISPKVLVNLSGRELSTDALVLDSAALGEILASPVEEPLREDWLSGDETAYLLFTSGSTGKPKGVPITAANLRCFYQGLLPYLPREEGGVILDQVSYSFDVSCCSLYAGLSRGMTLFTIDQELAEDMGALYAALGGSRLTMWASTPSFAELCVRSSSFSGQLLPEVASFLFCGEVLTHKLCDQLAERFPNARVLNTYGPTEATVLVTAAWVTEEMRRDTRSIPIGAPLSGVELCLVDAQGTPQESDDAFGELLILGESVGHGYYQRPELTQARFFLDGLTGKRGYRTGDICSRREGLYYYQGRADHQLKLHGHRIELEDIERNLARVENVTRAAVVPVWGEGRVQYLVGFLLLEKEDGLTPLKRAMLLRRRAAAYLPAYMIPRKLVAVDSFPLNVNGKIDRRELAERIKKL